MPVRVRVCEFSHQVSPGTSSPPVGSVCVCVHVCEFSHQVSPGTSSPPAGSDVCVCVFVSSLTRCRLVRPLRRLVVMCVCVCL